MLNCQKMFRAPRTAVYFHSLKSLAKTYRSLCLDKSHLFQANAYDDSKSSEQSRNVGYGEKEICLLQPVDARAPLPGNTGVAPVASVKVTSAPLPQINLDKNLQVFQTSEDRQKSTLAQLACAAVESVMHLPLTLECVAFECPQLLKNDFSDLFPRRNLLQDHLTVLTLCQKTKEDMSQWNEKAEFERSSLAEIFVIVAQSICSTLRESGYFADFIHPSTGKPFLGSSLTSATMFETDVRYSHFGFTVEDLGCCKVISHHLWGTHAFVGAIFTNASVNSPEIKSFTLRGLKKHST